MLSNNKPNWVCYILLSVDSNKTYVGATDNLYRRLCDHNGINGISKGAKATKGEQWMPVLFISGFSNKIACLSFESGVRRITRRKCCKKYKIPYNYKPIHKRIVSIHNLLYAGSPLNKWSSTGLKINYLEKQYYLSNLKIPDECFEGIDFNELDFNELDFNG